MCCVLDSPTVSYKTFLLLRSLLHTWVDNMVFWPSQERVVRFIPDGHHEKSFLHPAVHRRYQFWSRIFVRKRNALWRTSGFTKERGKQEKTQETSPGPSDCSSSTNRNNDWWHPRAKSSPWKRRQRWNWGWLIWYSIKSDRNDKPVFLPMVFFKPDFQLSGFHLWLSWTFTRQWRPNRLKNPNLEGKNHNGRFKENIFTIILDKTTDGRSQSCG